MEGDAPRVQFDWQAPTRTPEWFARRNCKNVDPDLFFPPDDRPWDPTPALAVCAACTVRAECLEQFIGERHGVFGGTTPRDRRELRRQRKEAA